MKIKAKAFNIINMTLKSQDETDEMRQQSPWKYQYQLRIATTFDNEGN